jgi:hypothetical protein
MNTKKRGRKSLLNKMEENKSHLTLLISDKTKYLLLFMAQLQRKSVDKYVEELVLWSADYYLNVNKGE